MARKVLLTGAYQYTDEQLKAIEDLGWQVTFIKNELTKLDIPVEEYDAVVCNGLFLYNDIARFKNLKMVQVTSAGLERLPIEYMEKHHILYYNAKGVYSIPMAEWAVMSILEIYKNAYRFFRKQQKKIWEKDRTLLELTDKKVCIIGYGSMGQETAKRLVVFGTEITAVNRSPVNDALLHRWVTLDRIDEVLPEADIVVLCIALTQETTRLFNENRLMKMKAGSVLINISRGAVIDENALIRCLQEERFRGVALDVFEEEPLPGNSKLWDDPRVIITPHNSFVGDKVRKRMFQLIYNNFKNMQV